ncbi:MULTISPECIES: hypothetical protein [Pseudomonadaceae]|uniref:hypothetical protein n=1 Tax=Pseudomonadaceae TaxID=135621 RepID=UPI001F0FADEC|nr:MULTISPECIES: hypothetical protein [Pseudomonas]
MFDTILAQDGYGQADIVSEKLPAQHRDIANAAVGRARAQAFAVGIEGALLKLIFIHRVFLHGFVKRSTNPLWRAPLAGNREQALADALLSAR